MRRLERTISGKTALLFCDINGNKGVLWLFVCIIKAAWREPNSVGRPGREDYQNSLELRMRQMKNEQSAAFNAEGDRREAESRSQAFLDISRVCAH